MSGFLTLNTGAELCCFLIGLYCLLRDKEPAWRGFVFFLFLTSAFEIAGIYVRDIQHKPNFAVYNVFTVIECLFISFFFYFLYQKYDVKRLALLISWLAIFFICYFAELTLKNYHSFVSATSLLTSVVFDLACLHYYYIILHDDQVVRVFAYPAFWWVSGVLLFYFGTTVCDVFFSYLVHDKSPAISRSINYVVFNVFNIILYLTWSFAAICRYRQRIYSS